MVKRNFSRMSKENRSRGAVPKATRSSKNKNRHRDLEIGTVADEQAVYESYEDDVFYDERGAEPAASPTKETRGKKRNKTSLPLEEDRSKKSRKEDSNAKKHKPKIVHNKRIKRQKIRLCRHEGIDFNDDALTSADTPESKKLKRTARALAKQKMDITDYNPPQKRKKHKHSKKSPHTKIRRSVSDDELTMQLENLHLTRSLVDMASISPKLQKRNCDSELPVPAVQPDLDSNFSNEYDRKEVAKRTKKRCNKDSKRISIMNTQLYSVLVKNLPLASSQMYRKKLTEVFEEFGCIKSIGPSKMCSEKRGAAMFSTKIDFETEAAATRALAKDNASFCGSAIRVSRPAPPTEADRCYNKLAIEELRAIFGGATPLRCVRADQRRDSGRIAEALLRRYNGRWRSRDNATPSLARATASLSM